MTEPVIGELSVCEGMAFFERRCQYQLGIDAVTFLTKWDTHEYDWDKPNPETTSIAMLIPFYRHMYIVGPHMTCHVCRLPIEHLCHGTIEQEARYAERPGD